VRRLRPVVTLVRVLLEAKRTPQAAWALSAVQLQMRMRSGWHM